VGRRATADRSAPTSGAGETPEAGESPKASPAPSELGPDSTPRSRRLDTGLAGWAVIAAEIVVAAAIAFSAVNVVSERQLPQSGTNPGGVSQANDTSNSAWLNAVLAPADKGGLPENSVIMSWWSASTTLWYGQKVLGMRPDLYIIDDSTRVDDNLGTVQDVFNRYLGNRPVFTIRIDGGVDGMVALSQEYDIETYDLGNGFTIAQVLARKGSQ
jgi:hypothetical protein